MIKPVAVEIGLVDRPSARKLHQGEVPLIGGISIFLSVLAASLIWLPQTPELRMYLIASSMIVFIGALDDMYDLKVRVRIIGQLIVASIMIYGMNSYIYELGDLFMLGNVDIGLLGIPFTYLCILAAINAFNMIDGIDGLVGSLSITAFASIALLFVLNEHVDNLSPPMMLAAAILPYLLHNLNISARYSKKIFMGDTGSMFIGLSIVWLLTTSTQGDDKIFRPVTALWLIAIPLMDMLAIIGRRMSKKQAPWKADREHLHHIFLRIGFTEHQALAFISVVGVLFAAFGIVGEIMQIPTVVMFGLFVVIFFIYSYCLKNIWKVVTFVRKVTSK